MIEINKSSCQAGNSNSRGNPLLSVENLHAGYDQSIILKDVSIQVSENEVVALLGRNGVGKTTLLNTILGHVSLAQGSISYVGNSMAGFPPDARARMGMGYVPQGRDIFPTLSVWENLQVSLSLSGSAGEERLDQVFSLFPVLKEMLKRKGGVLSGGQQQQLAIGRALLTNPNLLILDEPTEGIQPSIIDQIEDAIHSIKAEKKMSIILVEQYIDFARGASDYFYILERGSVVKEGPTTQLSDSLIEKYLTV